MSREAIGCFDRITLPGGAGVIWEMARPWTPPSVTLPGNPREALPGLMAFATRVWGEICHVFGGSRDLVELGYISKKNHTLLGDWLRNLETLVRRIVIIAALTLKLAPVKAARQTPWGPGRFRRTLWHDPTSWKVSFCMIPKAGGGRRRVRAKDKPWRSPARPAWPMARRIEALRRVLSYLPGCALRFARTLARIKARNATANEPRDLALAGWDFHPLRRTTGKHAVNDGMMIADPLAQDLWDRWLEPG